MSDRRVHKGAEKLRGFSVREACEKGASTSLRGRRETRQEMGEKKMERQMVKVCPDSVAI